MASKIYDPNTEVKKLVIGFSLSFFEMYVDTRWSEKELRSFLDAAWDLFVVDPNRKHFIQKLWLFFDELEEQRKPASLIGRYISERLKK